MIVDWGADGRLPCEIWCFIDLRDVIPEGVQIDDIGGCVVQKGVHAVVESCSYITDEEEVAMLDMFVPIEKEIAELDEEGNLTRRLCLADVEAFVEPVAVVPDVGSPNKCKCFHVHQRKTWAANFEAWVRQPHKLDVIDDEDDEDDED